MIERATARGEDAAVLCDALGALDELKAAALTWGARPPPDTTDLGRARRARRAAR